MAGGPGYTALLIPFDDPSLLTVVTLYTSAEDALTEPSRQLPIVFVT